LAVRAEHYHVTFCLLFATITDMTGPVVKKWTWSFGAGYWVPQHLVGAVVLQRSDPWTMDA